MYTKQERERYNEDRKRTCERLGITENDYNTFRRYGEALNRLYVANCNGDFRTEGDYEKAVQPLYAKADKKASKLGLQIFYQTDPRGATIYLDKVEIARNNYNRAVCIY